MDYCLDVKNSGTSQCRTLAPRLRSSACTDIPPDGNYGCTEQAAKYSKCDSDFMFPGAFCLKSCNRCGSE